MVNSILNKESSNCGDVYSHLVTGQRITNFTSYPKIIL